MRSFLRSFWQAFKERVERGSYTSFRSYWSDKIMKDDAVNSSETAKKQIK